MSLADKLFAVADVRPNPGNLLMAAGFFTPLPFLASVILIAFGFNLSILLPPTLLFALVCLICRPYYRQLPLTVGSRTSQQDVKDILIQQFGFVALCALPLWAGPHLERLNDLDHTFFAAVTTIFVISPIAAAIALLFMNMLELSISSTRR